jgi:hypothetical protein
VFFIKTRRGRWWLAGLTPMFIILIFCILHFFGEWIFVSRVVSIFYDGGTLNERMLPILDIINLSVNITPNPVAYELVKAGGDNGVVWYSSAAYILATFGWFGFLFMSLSFLRLGIFVGFVIFSMTLVTHIFSGAYSFFIVLAFLGFNNEKRKLTDKYLINPIPACAQSRHSKARVS